VLGDSIARASRRGSVEFPLPVLASDRQTPAVRAYVVWWIRHADPGGRFAAKTRCLRWLPASWLLRMLFAAGYDGLVYLKDDRVIGHVFFQRHGADLHGFSTAVSPPYAGHGYSVVILLDYLAHASRMPGVARARVGRGTNNVTHRFLKRLQRHAAELAWRVDLDGWVTFRREAGSDEQVDDLRSFVDAAGHE
jgi:hypothetical protein